MKVHTAFILAGGFGTRLRPFTFSKPKSLLDLGNIPIIEHQIQALIQCGVNHVVFGVGHFSEHMQQALSPLAEKYKIKLTFSEEHTPLGTAGPLSLVREYLTKNADGSMSNEPFFMLNSDVACSIFENLGAMVQSYENITKTTPKPVQGMMLITGVADPSAFGCVAINQAKNDQIVKFLEKPKTPQELATIPLIDGQAKINAGIYLLHPTVLQLIADNQQISIEKEIFPQLVKNGSLYAFDLERYHRENTHVDAYWMDIGGLDGLKQGTWMFLESLKKNGFVPYKNNYTGKSIAQQHQHTHPTKTTIVSDTPTPPQTKHQPHYEHNSPDNTNNNNNNHNNNTNKEIVLANNLQLTLPNSTTIHGNVLIHPTALIAPGAVLGPNVVIGANVTIHDSVRIKNSIILSDTTIEQSSIIQNSIIGWQNTIKPWAFVDTAHTGLDVTLAPEVVARHCVVCPHKSVEKSVENSIIM